MHFATSHVVIFVFTLIRYIHVFHLCVYFRWIPILVFPPDAKYCIYPRFPPPVTFCIFPLICHSISIWCYILHAYFFFKFSFHFGARDYTLCYKFMLGYLCLCTRSNNRNWIKKDEKTPFCVTILGRCFNSMSFPGC